MKQINVPVIVTQQNLEDAALVLLMFKNALADAFMQLAEDRHPESSDVDITFHYRVVKDVS